MTTVTHTEKREKKMDGKKKRGKIDARRRAWRGQKGRRKREETPVLFNVHKSSREGGLSPAGRAG